MKLLEQILSELGADTLKSFTVVPDFGGYFRGVKGVVEFSAQRVELLTGRGGIVIEGENLEVGKYFEGDAFIKGDVKVIKVE